MDNEIVAKLREVLADSQWTQEQLAYNLKVSFSTLNAWLNSKSTPRTGAVKAIDDMYLTIVGRTEIDPILLADTKKRALSKHITVREIVTNEELLDKVTLYLTYHTNTIEGSTMTLSDVKEVLDDDNKVLANKTAKEQTEARNHRTALYYLLDELNAQGKDFKWTKDLILNTHLRMMNTLISNAGMFRNHGVRIVGSAVPLANYARIPDYIDELIIDLNAKENDIIENMAKVHSRFEGIHPFSDGNGRTGRLIMFLQALQSGLVPPLIIKERKRAYYRYLETAHMDGNYSLLALFVAESILSADKLIK
ncbi:MAG: Fic family protein [Candidatus Nomurabacteria bacterium]|jgi:Fic family protein|nr:Fic family protein [Candidatus Nomurabacteria bacterium]